MDKKEFIRELKLRGFKEETNDSMKLECGNASDNYKYAEVFFISDGLVKFKCRIQKENYTHKNFLVSHIDDVFSVVNNLFEKNVVKNISYEWTRKDGCFLIPGYNGPFVITREKSDLYEVKMIENESGCFINFEDDNVSIEYKSSEFTNPMIWSNIKDNEEICIILDEIFTFEKAAEEYNNTFGCENISSLRNAAEALGINFEFEVNEISDDEIDGEDTCGPKKQFEFSDVLNDIVSNIDLKKLF